MTSPQDVEALRARWADPAVDWHPSFRTALILPSGRLVDLFRSRWDGVLDQEALAYCRAHGIPLAFDCAQLGWVPETCSDDSAGPAGAVRPPDLPLAERGPEDAADGLRRDLSSRLTAREAAPVDDAGTVEASAEVLDMWISDATRRFAAVHGVRAANGCHWVLRTELARHLDEAARPAGQSAAARSGELSFRRWTQDDIGAYVDLLSPPSVWEYLPEPYPSPFDEETARTLIELGSIGFHHDTLAVELDGVPVGQCLLRFDQPFAGVRAAEVAYWLGERHWGRGLMTRVLPEFVARSFREHDVDVIYAWIRKDHTASQRVATRAGFQRDAFPFEDEIAASLRRPGFIRYALYRPET